MVLEEFLFDANVLSQEYSKTIQARPSRTPYLIFHENIIAWSS